MEKRFTTNVETFVLHGLKRSGNHAFANWLCSGRGRIYHINNAFPISKEILREGYFDFPQDLRRLLWKHFFKRLYKIGIGTSDVLISIEDFPYSEGFFQTGRELRNLLIVRSPENVFASRIYKAFKVNMPAYPREMSEAMERTIELWINHVDTFVSRSGDPGFVGVYFDSWLLDKNYRAEIASTLGIDATTPVSAERSKRGGGSSFHGSARLTPKTRNELTSRQNLLTGDQATLLSQVLSSQRLLESKQKLDAFLKNTYGIPCRAN